jgi:uncharacterized protein YgiM (DUF1202 family)
MRTATHILLPALLASALVAGETRVRVTADRANLRYPTAEAVEVAGVVTAGDELTVLGPLEGNWVPVVPPDDVSAWVYGELVRKGRIVRDKTQLRAGPGLNFRIVGSLDHDAEVEPRGRLGDWLKIRLPPSLPVWISRRAVMAVTTSTPPDIVVLPPAVATGLLAALGDGDTNAALTAAVHAATEPEGTGQPPPAMGPAVPVAGTNAAVRLPLPPELASFTPAAGLPQGRLLRYTGTLAPALPGGTLTPARFRVTGRDRSGGYVTFCLVLAPEAQLAPLSGRAVVIEGPTWWLKGESVPVVKAERVAPGN